MANRARGQPAAEMVDIRWPHQVDLLQMNGTAGIAIAEWLHARVPAGSHAVRPGSSRLHRRYAFTTLDLADAFSVEFGGRRIDVIRKRPWT